MYFPQEDSLFFAEFLQNLFTKHSNKEKQNIKYLDMGTGSGILTKIAIQSKLNSKNITALDIDKDSIIYLKNKFKNTSINIIHSDLFSKIPKTKKFDIITFNTPYLPAHKHDKKPDTTGGEKGDEITLKFLNQAKNHLTNKGKIFLLISTHTPQKRIMNTNPKPKIIFKKKLFFEQLLILEIS